MIELCARQGYEETPLEQVLERAEVTEEDFVALFGSKADCAAEALNSAAADVYGMVGASFSPDRSEWDSAMLGIKAILEYMAAYPSSAQFLMVGCRQMCSSELKTTYDAGVHMLSAMLDRGRQYSSTGDQPSIASRAALGGAEAVVRREIAAGRTDRLPALLPDCVYAATVPFLGQEEGLRLARRARELLGELPSPQ